jgi:cystathionine beta-lyase
MLRALMQNDFDQPIDRRASDSVKWNKYPEGVLPLWVADLDFASPPAVLQALHERVDHGVFGYGSDARKLTEILVARLASLYAWRVAPEDIVYLPGVVPGFNLACLAFAKESERVVVQSPVYPPLLKAPYEAGCDSTEVSFLQQADGKYSVDWQEFESALERNARLFMLCNPQNPLGRVFTRAELEKMAAACLRNGTIICSDEIHCDLVFKGHHHLPIASLDRETAQRTITLMAPSKTYNLAGLQCSFAVIQNEQLRRQFQAASLGLMAHLNLLGCTAAVAAYSQGQSWLDELLQYLTVNRDTTVDYIRKHLPDIGVTAPEGTYLAWLDCTKVPALSRPYQFFLKHAHVALSDGRQFGAKGDQHVRLNFGCRRELLLEALNRMRSAVEQAATG